MNAFHNDGFIQGLAYSIAWIIRDHGFESVGIELLETSGYTYADLLKAHCDRNDLKPIAKALGLRLDGQPRKGSEIGAETRRRARQEYKTPAKQ